VVDSAQTWVEWHYFNYHDAAGRSLCVSISALASAGDLAPSGYSRGLVLLQYVDERGRRTRILDVLAGREIAASHQTPDVRVGPNAVRLDGGVYRVSVALADSAAGPVRASFDLEPAPRQVAPPMTLMESEAPFGYVVPVVRGRLTGRIALGGQSTALDGVGYHDHNWGHFRDAVWDWGIVHAGDISILYGRFARSADELAPRPVLVAFFDAGGPRPPVLTHDYAVLWKQAGALRPTPPPKTRTTFGAPPDAAGEVPHALVLRVRIGADQLELRLEVERRFVSETGGGEQPLFRADESARSFFIQMEGRARLSGTLDGSPVDLDGHAYAETFRVHP
jgi:hypothetical protein